MKRLASIVAVMLALGVCLFACGCGSSAASADSAITVSASGKAFVTPDSADVTIVALSHGDDYDGAIAAANRTAGDISARLKTAGAGESAITITTGEPEAVYGGYVEEEIMGGYYDWDGNWIETGPEIVGYDMSGEITGFDVSSTIKVTGIDASSLSTMLKEAVAAGATDFTSLNFAVSDREAAYQAALTAAVDAAHAKAEALAEASMVYVGRVVNMVENSNSADLVLTAAGDANSLNPADISTLEAVGSEIPVEASVTVSYAIS